MKYSFKNKNIVGIRKTIKRMRDNISHKNDREFAVYVLECDPLYDDTGKFKKYLDNVVYQSPSEDELEQKADRIAKRQDDDKEIVKKSLQASDYTYPRHLDLAINAETTLYVGQTNNLIRRIQQHLIGDGANFTSIFVPVGIRQVEWYDDRATAKKREKELSNELTTYEPEDCSEYIFAYSR